MLCSAQLSAVAIEVAQGCLDRLDGTNALADEDVVHEVRITTKRLRAAWHLVPDQAGKGWAKERRRVLSDMAAKLAGPRDLAVLTRLAQRLAVSKTDEQTAAALARLVACLAQRHAAAGQIASQPAGHREEIREDLAAEIAAWQALTHRAPRRRTVRRELRRSRRLARRDARKASRSIDPELWHDWRKKANRLRYQREFVAMAEDRRPGKFDACLRRLVKRLGKRHDLVNLTVLADTLLAAGDLSAADHGLVREAIAAVESGLIAKCRRLGKCC